MSTKPKLITDADVTMTGCLNAVKKLRNCPTCEFRNNKEACKAKKCVPRPVVDRIQLAVRESFHNENLLLKQHKQLSKEEGIPMKTDVDSSSSDIEKLMI